MRNFDEKPFRSKFLPSYFLSLLIPGYSFLFVLTGPHSILSAVLWILPMWATVFVDMWSPHSRKQPQANLNPYPYNSILYLLASLQIATILLLLDLSIHLQFGSLNEWTTSLVNLFAIKVIVGTSSSFSGIVVAHELIHRKDRLNQTLGRLLLSLECYEHFATEHIQGHHKNFGTSTDPATAQIGESFEDFWKRTVPAQFKNAWKLENKRLDLDSQFSFDPRYFYHRVVQGLVLEILLLSSIFIIFGVAGLVAFSVQAIAAVRKLEAVNYIEHWGLSRRPRTSGKQLSWDTDSWFTLNAIIGLSRHSDHHRHAGKPYYQLRYCPECPKLPYGYFATVFLSVFFNQKYQSLVRRQLPPSS